MANMVTTLWWLSREPYSAAARPKIARVPLNFRVKEAKWPGSPHVGNLLPCSQQGTPDVGFRNQKVWKAMRWPACCVPAEMDSAIKKTEEDLQLFPRPGPSRNHAMEGELKSPPPRLQVPVRSTGPGKSSWSQWRTGASALQDFPKKSLLSTVPPVEGGGAGGHTFSIRDRNLPSGWPCLTSGCNMKVESVHQANNQPWSRLDSLWGWHNPANFLEDSENSTG